MLALKCIKKGTIFLASFFSLIEITAQVNPVKLEQFVNNEAKFKGISLRYPADTREFYKRMQYHPVWFASSTFREKLYELFIQSSGYGLKQSDYQYSLTESIKANSLQLANLEDSIAAELRLTDAMIHFLHDVIYGNAPPEIGYNGLNYYPGCFDVPVLLANAVAGNQLTLLPSAVELKTAEYDSLREKIMRYDKIIRNSNFKEVIISSAKVNSANKPLLSKLFQLGFIDSAIQKLNESELKEKVKEVQKLFNLLSDGVLRSTSLEAFNVPLANRLNELNYAINAIRWLNCIKQRQKIIIVNIPSATLLVYENGRVILESKIIVGKRSTPTHTLCSKITEVILYPYWMVPYSIATKELLPSIKRNIGYLDANGYQVINRQGRVVNPYKVNWGELSRSNFPYIIRQSTGCDNSLGLVKLNFYNPYSTYLHDTPNKNLFSLNKRYFSHGCMRVEKAMELAHLVLKNNTIAIDTLEEKGCLYNQSPVVVPADEKIPVFVLYNTAWVDSSGRVSFAEDIYKKNQSIFKKD